MVLKVVTGKIFQALELYGSPDAWCSIVGQQANLDEGFRLRHGWSDSAVGRFRGCAHFKLSKNVDYLIDNFCIAILSQVKDEVNKKRTRCEAGSQIGKRGSPLFAKNATGRGAGGVETGRPLRYATGTSPFAQNAKKRGTPKRRLSESFLKSEPPRLIRANRRV
jgi:hypothetical protein